MPAVTDPGEMVRKALLRSRCGARVDQAFMVTVACAALARRPHRHLLEWAPGSLENGRAAFALASVLYARP